jgi:hypothetical protein
MDVANYECTDEEGTVGVRIAILQFTEGQFRFEPVPAG